MLWTLVPSLHAGAFISSMGSFLRLPDRVAVVTTAAGGGTFRRASGESIFFLEVPFLSFFACGCYCLDFAVLALATISGEVPWRSSQKPLPLRWTCMVFVVSASRTYFSRFRSTDFSLHGHSPSSLFRASSHAVWLRCVSSLPSLKSLG